MCLSHMYAVSHEVECEKINHQIPNEKKIKSKKSFEWYKKQANNKANKKPTPPQTQETVGVITKTKWKQITFLPKLFCFACYLEYFYCLCYFGLDTRLM